ncbi:probable alpha-ketoglutarate-dependent hypophosphite dioxygenase [Periplaneta americana]|uniref:probable alpha-ketoglutarate-dependent hypophosphite dioxygenase n=1 Tax=Periplaneta americana TaxID=6978 RepID=UPI0037E91C13
MLTKEQVDFYRENGYIKLDNIFTEEEINEISDEYDELFARKQHDNMRTEWRGKDMKNLAKNENVLVLAMHNLQFHSEVFTRLLMNKKFLDAMEDIMQTHNILLHHNKAHLKPPEKGAPYLMHQDYHYFPFKNHSMVAAFFNLEDTSPENGGLAVYPGSHKLGPLEDAGVVDKGESIHYVDPEKYPLSGATPIYAKKGDIVVFSYLLLHGSYVNKSDRPRRMFLVQLMSADDEPLKDVHKSVGQGMVLRGRNVKRDASMATRFVQ